MRPIHPDHEQGRENDEQYSDCNDGAEKPSPECFHDAAHSVGRTVKLTGWRPRILHSIPTWTATPVQRIVHGRLNRRTIYHPERATRYHGPVGAAISFIRRSSQARSVVSGFVSAWHFIGMLFPTQEVRQGNHLLSRSRHSNNRVSRPKTPTEGNDVNEETTSQRNMFSRKTSAQRTPSFREPTFQRTCFLRRGPFTEEIDVVERTARQ